jgi:hypothetical protein
VNIARVERETNVVVNIEIADDSWLEANADDVVYRFVPYSNEVVIIGGMHDPETGNFNSEQIVALPTFPSNDDEFLDVNDDVPLEP